MAANQSAGSGREANSSYGVRGSRHSNGCFHNCSSPRHGRPVDVHRSRDVDDCRNRGLGSQGMATRILSSGTCKPEKAAAPSSRRQASLGSARGKVLSNQPKKHHSLDYSHITQISTSLNHSTQTFPRTPTCLPYKNRA